MKWCSSGLSIRAEGRPWLPHGEHAVKARDLVWDPIFTAATNEMELIQLRLIAGAMSFSRDAEEGWVMRARSHAFLLMSSDERTRMHGANMIIQSNEGFGRYDVLLLILTRLTDGMGPTQALSFMGWRICFLQI